MELCVWIEDREDSGDVLHDLAKFRKGDVIEALPDGSHWGKEPPMNPKWRIIRVPGMTQAEADSLRSEEALISFGSNHIKRARHMHIDLDALDALEGGTVLSSRPHSKTYHHPVDVTVLHSNVRKCLKIKDPLKNPHTIS